MGTLPAKIGRYKVERLLGEGGMGVLYLARDPVIDRHVALKLLRVNGEDLRRRFMREAQSAGRLQHPNVVTVYDVGDHDGQLFIAMEYIDGDTLATLIRDDVPFSAIRKLDIIDEVAGVYPRIMQEGRLDAGAWSCGMVAGLIHDIPTVQDLVRRIMAQAEALIRQRLAGTLEASGPATRADRS